MERCDQPPALLPKNAVISANFSRDKSIYSVKNRHAQTEKQLLEKANLKPFCAARILTQAVALSGRIGVTFRGKACAGSGQRAGYPPPPPSLRAARLGGGCLFKFTPAAMLLTTGEFQAAELDR